MDRSRQNSKDSSNEHFTHSLQMAALCFVALTSLLRANAADAELLTVRAKLLEGYTFTNHFTGALDYSGLTQDKNGNTYITRGYLGGCIYRLSQDGVLTVFAGSPTESASVDGPAASARFHSPYALTFSGGNLFVADAFNCTIRKVAPDGFVTTFAGRARTQGSDDGPATDARFNYPMGIASDADGNIYVADHSNQTIRKINREGYVSTLAGVAVARGTNDGHGALARFSWPRALAVSPSGAVFVAEFDRVRKINSNGMVRTLAGGGQGPGYPDGRGSEAHFGLITGIAIDPSGNAVVLDSYARTLRKVTDQGVVSTLLTEPLFLPLYFQFGGDSSSLHINPSGTIVVGDAGAGKLYTATPPSSYLWVRVESSVPFVLPWATIEASSNLTGWSELPGSPQLLSTYFKLEQAPHEFFRAKPLGP